MHRTLRAALAAVASTTVVLTALSFSTPAGAASAYYDDEDGCSSTVPGSHTPGTPGEAPVANDDTAAAVNGAYVAIDVLANDTDADNQGLSLVNVTDGKYGDTDVCDGLVEYYPETAPAGTSTDTFRYGVTDGEYYRSAQVTVTVTTIVGQAPKVTKKLVVSKGKVTGKAEISLTDPDADYPFRFIAANPGSEDDALISSRLAPLQTKKYHVAKRNLEFYVFASSDDDDFFVSVLHGTIDTLTGRVKVSDDEDGGFRGRQALRAGGLTAAHHATGPTSAGSVVSCDDDGTCEDDCAAAPVPATPATPGAAPSVANDTATVLSGGSVLVDVLKNDVAPDGQTLSLVGAGNARYGSAQVCDGQVEYSLADQGGAPTSDTFRYAVTDGQHYRTATATVSIVRVTGQAPVVTTKLALSKGKVVRKAKVSVTNPDSTYTFRFFAVDVDSESYQIGGRLAPGETKVFSATHRHLFFGISVVDADDNDLSDVMYGEIDTLTGKVSVDDDSGVIWVVGQAKARAAR